MTLDLELIKLHLAVCRENGAYSVDLLLLHVHALIAEVEMLREEKAKLREALNFYASEESYKDEFAGDFQGTPIFSRSPVIRDGGTTACKALGETNEDL